MLLKYPDDDIDDEIERHVQALVHLRTRRNKRRSLIHQLPSDIMIEIFLIYRARILKESFALTFSSNTSPSGSPREDSDAYRPIFHHPIPFVGVTYVCSLWRKIALQCASLWTHLSLDNFEWTKELLIRSKGATLVIWPRRTKGLSRSQGLADETLLSSLRIALAESDRIGVLWLNLRRLGTNVTDALMNCPLPALRTVYLFGSAYSRWYGGFEVPFIAHIFRYLLPQLRELTVLDRKVLTIETTALSSTTLTHLQLVGKGRDFSSIQKPTTRAFLSSLENLLSLRVLSLINILGNEELDSRSSTVVLQSLEAVTLYHKEFSMKLMSTFLDALDLPSCSQLTVGCSGSTNSMDEARNLLTSISCCRFGLTGKSKGKYRAFSGTIPYRSLLVASKRDIFTLAFSQTEKNVQPLPVARRSRSRRHQNYNPQWHPSLEVNHSDLRIDILSFPLSADERILHSAILPFIDELSPGLEHTYLCGQNNFHFYEAGLAPWLSVLKNRSTLRAIEVDVHPSLVKSLTSELRPSGKDSEAGESDNDLDTLKSTPFAGLEILTLWRLRFLVSRRSKPRIVIGSLADWRNSVPNDTENLSPPGSPSGHQSQAELEEELYKLRSIADPDSSSSSLNIPINGGDWRLSRESIADHGRPRSESPPSSRSISTVSRSISPYPYRTNTPHFDSDSFVSMLRARRDDDIPVRRLEFRECFSVSEDALSTFYEVIDDVWWDGNAPSREPSIDYSLSSSSYRTHSY